MATFQEFVSAYAQKCGGGVEEAAPVWNREKETIKQLTKPQVLERLECP